VFYSRGKANIAKLVGIAKREGLDFIIIVLESQGNPSALRIIKIDDDSWHYTHLIKLKLHKLRKEFLKKKVAIEELQLKLKNRALKRVLDMLGIENIKSEFVFKEEKSFLSFFYKNKEIGPRFEIYDIKRLSL